MTTQIFNVDFHGHSLTTLKHEGIIFVAMRSIVEGIGLDWKTQHRKLISQSEKFSCGYMTTTGADGKQYKMLCIPLVKLNGWLFSINPEKVKRELKQKVIHYQEECFVVLYDYWHRGEAINSRFYEVNTTSPLISNLRERLALIEMKRRLSLSLQRVNHPEQLSLKKSLNEISKQLGENPLYFIE